MEAIVRSSCVAVSPQEWDNAAGRAIRKLEYIIERYGDANGQRREPWYLEQLIAETIAADRLTKGLETIAATQKWGQKKDSPCPKTQGRPDTNPYCSTMVSEKQ